MENIRTDQETTREERGLKIRTASQQNSKKTRTGSPWKVLGGLKGSSYVHRTELPIRDPGKVVLTFKHSNTEPLIKEKSERISDCTKCIT